MINNIKGDKWKKDAVEKVFLILKGGSVTKSEDTVSVVIIPTYLSLFSHKYHKPCEKLYIFHSNCNSNCNLFIKLHGWRWGLGELG